MTAQYLLRQTYRVKEGDTMLVHAAAGGVGLILCQWGRALGATVIGTVATADKAKLAKEAGAHHIIVYRNEDFVKRVHEITKGEKCHVVYDGVGKKTYPGSLECRGLFGTFASFGSACGRHRRLRHRTSDAQRLALRHPTNAWRLRGRPGAGR